MDKKNRTQIAKALRAAADVLAGTIEPAKDERLIEILAREWAWGVNHRHEILDDPDDDDGGFEYTVPPLDLKKAEFFIGDFTDADDGPDWNKLRDEYEEADVYVDHKDRELAKAVLKRTEKLLRMSSPPTRPVRF